MDVKKNVTLMLNAMLIDILKILETVIYTSMVNIKVMDLTQFTNVILNNWLHVAMKM